MPTIVALGFSQIGLETVMVVCLLLDEAKVIFFDVFIFAHDDPTMPDSFLDMSIDQIVQNLTWPFYLVYLIHYICKMKVFLLTLFS